MMKLNLNLKNEDYEDFKDMLHTCAYEDLFIINGHIAEKVLRQIENEEH